MVANKRNSDGNYYVGIEDANNFRKELLSASKNIIVVMKKYEHIKHNRKDKIELFSDLKGKANEINVLIKKLKGFLPEYKIRHLPHRNIESDKKKEKKKNKEEKKAPKKKQTSAVPRHSELDKLEQELKIIESKLTAVK